nr:zinc ribbon domain-containing protein [uncultured Acetatifactor sp.]
MREILNKMRNRLPILCGAVLLMFLLAGCSAGSTIDANLVINKDLSGVRQMNIAISEDVFQEYFTGSIEDLNALIAQNCPQGMTWTYSEEGGVRQYNMEIAFSSPEEYREKVTSILGSEPEQLEIAAPDTVWASGISVAESFTNQDLLKWMRDLLVGNGFVPEEQAGMIFSDGTTNVVYGDQTYRTGSRINVSEVEYVTIDSMQIMTQVNDLGNYSRQVVIQIPASSMNKKGEEIKAFMDGVVPASATGTWEESEERTIFTVSAQQMDPAGLAAFNTAVFVSPECTVDSVDVSSYFSPFTFGTHLTEHIDLSGYLAGDYSSFHVSYEILMAEDYQAYSSSDGISQDYGGWLSEESGYYVLGEGWCNGQPMDYSILIQKNYKVQELSVETARHLGGDLTRTSSFALEKVPTDAEQQAMVQAVEAKAGIVATPEDAVPESADEVSGEDTGETDAASPEDAETPGEEEEEPEVAEVTISGELVEDAFQVVISQKGSPEAISRSTEPLFDGAGTLSYAVDREFWKVKKQEAFTENLSFGNFLDQVTEDFRILYTVKLGMFRDMQYCSDEEALMEGGTLSMETDRARVSVTYVGTKLDLLAILFWVLVALGVLNLLITLVKAGLFKKLPKIQVKQAGAAAPAGTAPAPTAIPEAGTAQAGTTSAAFGGQSEVGTTVAVPVTEPAQAVQPSQTATEVPVTGTVAQPVPAVTVDQERTPAVQADTVQAVRFCPKCGTPREAGSMFCEECGSRFEE